MDMQMIDTVALIRQIRENHYQCLLGKTHEELIAFYRERAQEMQGKTVALLADNTSVLTSKVQPCAANR